MWAGLRLLEVIRAESVALKLCFLEGENWLILQPLDGVAAQAGGHCPLTEHLPRRLTLRPPWSTVYTYTKLSWEPTVRYAPSGGGGGGAMRRHPGSTPFSDSVPHYSRLLSCPKLRPHYSPRLGLATQPPRLPPASD